jgi:hypothetical protein
MRTCVRVTKLRERSAARALRTKGWPLRRIARALGVSLSSASVWTRDVEQAPGLVALPVLRSRLLFEPRSDLRQCGRCRQELPASEFNRDGDGYQWWCRVCYRRYFQARGELHRRQVAEALERRRQAARNLIHAHFASHACVDCGEADPQVLEFDHLREKRGDVSALAFRGLSLASLQQEIDKCDVVCVNCHRRRTAWRIGSWRLRPFSVASDLGILWTRARNLAFARDALLETGCVDCGEEDLLVLEFDHIGPKQANVSDLVRDGCSLSRLKQEIDRCEVRCSNCHRRRTRRLLARDG